MGRLLNANADFNTQDSYNQPSAIVRGAERGHFQVVRILLEAEKHVTSVDRYFSLEDLQEAVKNGQHGEVKRFKAAKKVLDLLHEQKCLALKVAAERGDKRIVEMLVEAAADVNTDESSLCHTTPTGAAIAGNLGLVDYLIEHGANINIIPTTFRRPPAYGREGGRTPRDR